MFTGSRTVTQKRPLNSAGPMRRLAAEGTEDVRRSRAGSIRLRKARPTDLRVLVEHRHRMWSDVGGRSEKEIATHYRAYRRWLASRLGSGELFGFVAETEGHRVIGSGCLWFHPDQPRPGLLKSSTPNILSMFTEPAYRGRGVGTRIVREAMRMARKRGFRRIVLHAAPLGRSLYRRLGFERTWEMRRWLGGAPRRHGQRRRPPPVPR